MNDATSLPDLFRSAAGPTPPLAGPQETRSTGALGNAPRDPGPGPARAVDTRESTPQPGRPVAPLALKNQTAAQEQQAGESPPAAPPLIIGKEEKGPDGLTEEEHKKVEELKRRDREVRSHEQAHKNAGGPLAGQPQFETERGPDGRTYAVNGEVSIDTSAVPNNPDATIRKMEIVKRAALAPSQPSAKDRQVAADAERKAQQARQEKREAEAEERAKSDVGRTDPTNRLPAFRLSADNDPAPGQNNRDPAPGGRIDIVT